MHAIFSTWLSMHDYAMKVVCPAHLPRLSSVTNAGHMHHEKSGMWSAKPHRCGHQSGRVLCALHAHASRLRPSQPSLQATLLMAATTLTSTTAGSFCQSFLHICSTVSQKRHNHRACPRTHRRQGRRPHAIHIHLGHLLPQLLVGQRRQRPYLRAADLAVSLCSLGHAPARALLNLQNFRIPCGTWSIRLTPPCVQRSYDYRLQQG